MNHLSRTSESPLSSHTNYLADGVNQSILLGDPFQGFKKKDQQATEHLGLYPQLPLAGLKTS